MSNMSEFSISCWTKPTSSNLNNSLFLVRRDGSHQIRLSSDGFCFRDNHHSSQTVVSFGEPFLENIWTHISCVYKKGIIYLYQNGIQTNSANYYHEDSQTNSSNTEIRIGRQQFSSGNNYFTGYINDFRIYDHALSPMEVKQISQGLILHYPLNAKNLFNYHATTYAKSFAPSGNIQNTTGWAISDYIPIFPNQSYLGIGLSAGGSNTYAVLYDVNKNKTRTILEVANQNLIVNSNQNEYYIRLSIRDFNHELTTTAKFLENNDIQYDTSGYCNNGIKVGTFDYDNDTPKYNVSTKIAASATGIKLTNFSIGNIWSMSVWFKYPSQDNTGWKALVILNNSGSDSDLQFGNYINCNDGRIQYSANGKYNSSSVHLIFGEWNHLVSTYDGTTLRCYFNGEYKASLTPGQTLSNKSNLGVGFKSNAVDFSTFGASMTNGLLSDVRVYTTALSADDVKSLYQNSAYIDNQGNIYGAIYEEV